MGSCYPGMHTLQFDKSCIVYFPCYWRLNGYISNGYSIKLCPAYASVTQRSYNIASHENDSGFSCYDTLNASACSPHIMESYEKHGLPLFPSLHLQCEGRWYLNFDPLEQSMQILPQMI